MAYKGILPIDGNGADGASEVYVARGGQVLGSIRIADVLRPEAKNAVAAMRQMGLKTVLLSGDAQAVTASVGRDLGVDEAVGELLPEQKAKWVSELRGKKRKVAMVGDGINDAPALVEANVGIAMGSGTDVAQGERGCDLDRKRSLQVCRNLAGCSTLSWDHHAEFRGHAGSGQHRSWNGSFWLSESAPGCLYSRDLGVGIHPEFHEIIAPEF